MVLMDNIIEWCNHIFDPFYGFLIKHVDIIYAVVGGLILLGVAMEIFEYARRRRLYRSHAGCPFCAVVDGHPVTQVVREWRDAIALEPLDPVVDGHLIVISRWHVRDAAHSAKTTARVMRRVAELIAEQGGQYNIITSIGSDATQTVFHLHIHIVPRKVDDGLALPWTGQEQASASS